MAIYPDDGFTYVGHGGRARPSLVVALCESHSGVVVLATTTAVAAVVVPISVIVAVVTVAEAAAVILARRVRRRKGRRQWSRRCFVGVEHCRSSSWTGGIQLNFLHHGIRWMWKLVMMVSTYDGEVVAVSRRGSGDQLRGGGLPFKIEELMGG
jgi:hypothetical protein